MTFSAKQVLRGVNAGVLAGFSIGMFYTVITYPVMTKIFGAFPFGLRFLLFYGIIGLIVGAIISFFYEKIKISNNLLKNMVLAVPISLIATIFTVQTQGFLPIGKGFLWYPFLAFFDMNYFMLFSSAFATWFVFCYAFSFFWNRFGKKRKK